MKIAVVGAGPAGSYSAFLLAKAGHEVMVFEKNRKIGEPVQCTGILSEYFSTLLKPSREFVLNTVDETRIHAPNGDFVFAKINTNYVVCRRRFDNYLADMARSMKVKYFLNTIYKGHQVSGHKIKVNLSGKVQEFDILVGADGPNSLVAKDAGLFGKRSFLIGTQAEIMAKNDNVVDFFPYIGCYAWIVPVNKKVVRVGVAAYSKSGQIFKEFVRERYKDFNKRLIEYQSGVIPVFDPYVRAQSGNVFLVGDAATFNKATSGGGINQALVSAMALSESLLKNRPYDSIWKKKMYRKLELHLVLHKMMGRFSHGDWNDLIKTFSARKMKRVLSRESRDNITKMLFAVALRSPGLIRYIKYFPKEEINNAAKAALSLYI